MSEKHLRGKEDARSLMVELSPSVRSAFQKLADVMVSTGHFDADVNEIVQRWASNRSTSIHDILIALPMLFEQALAVGNKGFSQQLAEAWGDIATQMAEPCFSVVKRRSPAVRF